MMIPKLHAIIQVTMVSIAWAVMYELKPTLGSPWDTTSGIAILAVLTYIATSILSSTITQLILKAEFVRMLSFNRAWIEGYWYVRTFRPGNPNPITMGLAHISYGPDLELNVRVHKLRAPESKLSTVSKAELAIIDPKTLNYINYFNYIAETKSIFGVALGTFYLDGRHIYPTRYEGILKYFSNHPDERQMVTKIPKKRIIQYMRQSSDWEELILEEIESDVKHEHK